MRQLGLFQIGWNTRATFFLEKLTKKIKYDDNVSFDSTDCYSGEISKLVSPEIVCDLNHWLEVGCQ